MLCHNDRMVKKKSLAGQVQKALQTRYPIAASQLEYKDPWQLLVAVILSAQCTDARVNEITPRLFSLWPGPEQLAAASQEELERVIHSAGFFRNKAKNLRACAKIIHERYANQPPRSLEDLIKLPGVARKTANVVLFAGYGINEGFAVDTHVKRITYRLGLTGSTDPVKIEKDLMEIFPQQEWGNLNHRFVWFGRDVCQARRPNCAECELEKFCPKNEPGPQPEPVSREVKK